MHLDHFGLRTDPFPLYPSLKFIFLSTPFEEAMAHLTYGLEQAEDIILITGPIGTGKTLAVQSLLTSLSKSYRTAFVNVTQLSYPELLKTILADLNAPVVGGADRADLLAAMKEQVRQARERGEKILIVVDEAQNLAPDVLEGLRLLTNLGQPEGQAVQLVLVGQPELERRIALPELAQLRQRIRIHYRLETLDRRELEAYVSHRLKVAGCERQLFKPKALDVIFLGSRGVPRLVNILGSRALLSAFVAGKKEVDAGDVDLDDLPPATGVGEPTAPPRVTPAAGPEAAPSAAPAPPVAPAPPPAPARAPVRGAPAAPVAMSPEPFTPTTIFRRRGQRGGALFLAAMGLLVVAAAVVFLGPLRPTADSTPTFATSRSASPAAPATPAPAAARDTAAAAADSVARHPVGPARKDSVATAPAVVPATAVAAVPPAAPKLTAALKTTAAPKTTSAPVPAPAPRDSLPAAAPAWGVHVHSFRAVDHARIDVEEIRRAGFPVFFLEATIYGEAWQRVVLGPYASEADAKAAALACSQAGLTTYAQVIRLPHEGR